MEFVPSIETKLLHERLAKVTTHEEVIAYEELSSLIGQDITNGARHLLQTAMDLARKHERKVFGAVRGVGLKWLTDSEIANSGEGERKSYGRKAKRHIRKLECVEFDKLTTDDKVKHQVARTLSGFVAAAASAQKVKQLEGVVSKENMALTFAKTLEAFKK